MLKIDDVIYPTNVTTHKGAAKVVYLGDESTSAASETMVSHQQENREKTTQKITKKEQKQKEKKLLARLSLMQNVALIFSGIGVATAVSWVSLFKNGAAPQAQTTTPAAAPQIIYVTPNAPAPVNGAVNANNANATPNANAQAQGEQGQNTPVHTANTSANAPAAAPQEQAVPTQKQGATEQHTNAKAATNNTAQPVAHKAQQQTQPATKNNAANTQPANNSKATPAQNAKNTPAPTANVQSANAQKAQASANVQQPVTKHSHSVKSIGIINPQADSERLRAQQQGQGYYATAPVTNMPQVVAGYDNGSDDEVGMVVNKGYLARKHREREQQVAAYMATAQAQQEKTTRRQAVNENNVAQYMATPEMGESDNTAKKGKCSPFKTRGECEKEQM